MKRKRTRIVFETLEARHMLSGVPSVLHLVSSELARDTIASETGDQNLSVSDRIESAADTEGTTRWDWLAGTQWYVPTDNLLAYTAPLNLSDPTAVADQTLWSITTSSGGHITGQSVAKLSSDPTPSQLPFTGIVTEEGQVRMEFISTPGQTVTGIGQMRFIEGQWRVQMQMATGITSIVTHWAYMSLLPAGDTPPPPSDPPPGSLRSEEWRWVEGTLWTLADTDLLGDGSGVGIFAIDSYRNGYFWGSGMSSQPFNVLGSITPEGNVLLLTSVAGGQPEVRMGQLVNGTMLLRTYEGNPAIGSAHLLDNPRVPSSRAFVTSVLAFTQG